MHLNPLLDEDYYAGMERSARQVFASTDIHPDLRQVELRP